MSSFIKSEEFGSVISSRNGGKSWEVKLWESFSEGRKRLHFGSHSTETQAEEALAWYSMLYCASLACCERLICAFKLSHYADCSHSMS